MDMTKEDPTDRMSDEMLVKMLPFWRGREMRSLRMGMVLGGEILSCWGRILREDLCLEN